jgi:hypothetical protein
MALKKANTPTKKINPFEDQLDLTTLVRLKKGGYAIGAYLLSKKQVGDTDNTLQLIFGYSCTGVNPLFNSEEQVEALARAFENGYKEIPQGERFTFRWSSSCDEEEVIEHFRHRLSNPVNDESEFLDWGCLARLQELTRQKKRKKIVLNVYTTFTIKPGGTEAGDAVDRAIVKLSNFLQRRFTSTGATELTRKNLMQILEKAINISLRYQQILAQMGLNPAPKTEKELWKELTFLVGAKSVKVPHTLVFDEQGLAEEFHEVLPKVKQYIDNAHITSVLLNNGIPYADRQWVCLPNQKNSKGKYVGVMTLTQKPEAFVSTVNQVRFVQPLDLSKIPKEQQEERVKAHRNDVNLIVLQLVLGSQSFDGFLAQTIESLIPLGIKAFYDDPDIQRRFVEAKKGGLGSAAWENTPTLVDMERFFDTDHISLGYEDENVDKALNYIRLRLQYWQASSIGEAICKPSTFETDSQLITFALTNLQSSKDAEVFGMSAYIAASRQSLASPNSVFFMDEASVLLRFPALSRLVGRKCATARKSGCRIILAAQDVISIAKSEAGEQILQNMPLRLIGKIVPGAANSFCEILGIPREIIDKNETFTPNIQQLYTLWLLDYNNKYIRCRYYPSYPLLALVANSREEQAKRDEFKEKYQDKFEWIAAFSKYYVECIQQGQPL